ncbi:FosA family fosfomycin resistance glutathione transferase [Devosia pacifica]|uniref:FosA family fosfomycin resistance glutathione transferase n=1 Tax=Devosia pacifica TaxID=1335967 RepID=A0A918S491_9HYPH|nr:VOC family protein [Devosia pacifica]GHA23823.1 FosA family fosfomycin resistance glutathione transferase [Devosia pacifica]
MTARISGVNHITLAVTDLERSISFYRDILGCGLRAVWTNGAYLEAGDLWLCLSLDKSAAPSRRDDYTHIAFSASDADYAVLRQRLLGEARLWQDNSSEGASIYFLDPDGHKLELHLGSLQSRLAHYRAHPDKGVTIVET